MEDSEQIPTVANVNSGESVEGRREVLRKCVDVCSEGLSQDEQKSLMDCVLGAQDVFSTSEQDRGEVTCMEHHIETGDSPPMRQPPR